MVEELKVPHGGVEHAAGEWALQQAVSELLDPEAFSSEQNLADAFHDALSRVWLRVGGVHSVAVPGVLTAEQSALLRAMASARGFVW